jgi:hypothetical protein
MTDLREGTGRTFFSTFQTQITPAAIDKKGLVAIQGVSGAGFQAGIAGHTLLDIETDFHFRQLAFRIVAPNTGQGAAFEKNDRSNAGAIVQCIAFDFQDERRFQFTSDQKIILTRTLTQKPMI